MILKDDSLSMIRRVLQQSNFHLWKKILRYLCNDFEVKNKLGASI